MDMDGLGIIIMVVAYVVLMRYVLPKLGVPT